MKYANNPANIRFVSSNKWLGLVSEPRQRKFCEFISLDYGLRALLHILFRYYYKYHLCSVADIISRFAPSVENDTDNYIIFVSNQVLYHNGYIFVDGSFNSLRYLLVIAKAICFYESHSVIDLDVLESVYTKYIKPEKLLNIKLSHYI